MPKTPLPKTSNPAEAALHGVGPKALYILREALAAHGVRYREE